MKTSIVGRWLALLCVCLAVVVSMPLRAAEPVPVAAFVARPDVSAVKLSPSGKFIALTVANKSGRTDAARVCIVGASYGGYAALMAPIRYHDLFKCSVAWVAVSDPRLMFEESWQNDIGRQAHFSMRTMIGDPVQDAAMLKAAAPAEHAAEIKIPVLMAY